MNAPAQKIDITDMINTHLNTGAGTNATMWQTLAEHLDGASFPEALHPVLNALRAGEAHVVMGNPADEVRP